MAILYWFLKNDLSLTTSLYTKIAIIHGKGRLLIPSSYWLAQFLGYESRRMGWTNTCWNISSPDTSSNLCVQSCIVRNSIVLQIKAFNYIWIISTQDKVCEYWKHKLKTPPSVHSNCKRKTKKRPKFFAIVLLGLPLPLPSAGDSQALLVTQR